ncbi:MAG: tRNA lysidine(34) synthetase TilS, partial [Lachnospiraceae bacterium]|nr:tRNA lysidine(34) synthetase TilS [Lachnospiraceae bacterium]
MKTANEIEKKVFSYIEEHHMLETGDLVVAGVSGGADSVCLLFVLLSYAKIHPIKIAVVHMDHKIRPESGEDADFVRRLCEENNLPFYLYEKQINDMAVEMKCSTEEAGRMARYQAFSEVADKLSKEMTDSEKKAKVKIAIAHNKNDTCETMLFHLFRGSGLKGLCGILPVRDKLIRPLLCLQRSEIETYLAEMGVSYCTDATNAEDDYTRNRIRHNIL